VDKSAFKADAVVSFVSMPAVEAETGKIDVTEKRKFSKVKQGYTPFKEDDVLFAKITPCMENGKMAIVPKMVSKYGFGSTEFHVLRPTKGIDPKFIYHMVSNQGFRYHAERNMTGAVGQKRVPAAVLEEYELGLPPTNEQRRIVEQIEALFKDIDKGVESLRATKASIGLYRQSLLKSAFEGRLTADWRTQNADKLENPEVLLARIRAEREARYTAAVAAWQEALTQWRAGGEKGKRPRKPKRPIMKTNQPHLDVISVSDLPESWAASKLVEIVTIISGTTPKGIDSFKGLGVPFFKVSDMNTLGNEKTLFSAQVNVSIEGAASLGLPICPTGTVVFPKRGGAILTNKKRRLGQPSSFDLNTMGLVNETSTVLDDFLWFWMIGVSLSEIYDGSNVPQINNKNVEPLSFPICSPAEQAEIVRLLDTRLDAADALEAEIDAALARATALRQSVLKKAFSGKLVPQDPEDEPATMLLERIRTERDKVTKQPRRRLRP